ncbi:hypothetical protein SB783_43360, partial [Paraburkholderia sp. SIMBA_009]
DTVSDILVNGPDQVYVERAGRLELTSLKFRDNAHVTSVAQRIAAAVGRRMGCDLTMKTIFCLVAAALLCAACAQGGSDAAGGRGGSIEMYG